VDPRSEKALELDPLDEKIHWIDPERVAVRPAPEPFVERLPDRAAPGVFSSRRNRIVLIGVLVLLALLIGLAVHRRMSSMPVAAAPTGEPAPLVSVSTATLSPVTANVSFTGSIRARYEMPVGAEAESGRVAAIYVEAGDHVAKGQLLARLDTSILGPQVTRLRASLEEAKAEAELAAAEFKRAEAVAAAGALSAEEIERRRSTSVTKDAQVKVAAAQLAEAEARLGRTEIRAPEAGLVLSRSALIGQTVTPGGEPLFRLARGGEVEMVGQVAEQDLPRLKVGDPAEVTLTGIDHPFVGKLRLLGAVIDSTTRLGDVRVALDPDPNLRPGAFARAQVTVSQAVRPVLPETAVLSDAKGNYVYVIDATDHVVRRSVRIGGPEGNGISIAEGLQGGERVVTTAAAYLREGEAVRVAIATP
jgi:RND family efflux transporter MFP subunit